MLFSNKSYFGAFYGGYLPLMRVCLPCNDESCGTLVILCSICYRYYLSADNTSITIFITIIYCLASFSVVMDQFMFVQSCRRINYHDDIVLRTPTVSIG